MMAEVQPLKRENSVSKFERLLPHAELIASLASGVLILAGWLASRDSQSSVSVALFLSAFSSADLPRRKKE